MAANNPVEVNIDSESCSTQTLEFDDVTLKAIAEVYMIEGNKEYKEKKFKNAIQFFTEGIEVNCKDEESNAKLYSNRAAAHFCVGNFTETLSDAKAAIGLRPGFIKAIVKGTSACMELKLFDEGITWCVKGLSIDPNNKTLLELKSRLVDEIHKHEKTQLEGVGCRVSNSPQKLLEGAVVRQGEATIDEIECPEFIKEIAKEAFKIPVNRKDEAQSYYCRGIISYIARRPDLSIECFEKELAIRKEISDKDGECSCYNNLGVMYHQTSQFENAIRCHEKGLEIAKETGNTIEQKRSLSRLAFVLINDLHQYERGIDFCKKAIDLTKETGDIEGELYNHFGHAYHALGQHDKSITILEEALEINRTTGEEKEIFISYLRLGEAFQAVRKYKKSAECFKKAANVSKAIGKNKNEVNCYINIACVFIDMEQYEKSVEYSEKAIFIAQKWGYTEEIEKSCINIGRAYDRIGQHDKSIEYYMKALRQLETGTKSSEMTMVCLIELGTAYRKLGQFEKAIEHLKTSLDISKAIGNMEGMVKIYDSLSFVYNFLGQHEKSMEFLKKALDSASSNIERSIVYIGMMRVATIQGEFDEMIMYGERALEIMRECAPQTEIHVFLLMMLGWVHSAPETVPACDFGKASHYFFESIKNYEHVREGLEDEYKILVDDRHAFQYESLSRAFLSFREVRHEDVVAALCIAERGRARALEDLICMKYSIQKRHDSHDLTLNELNCLFTKKGCEFLFVATLLSNLFSFVAKPGAITVSPRSNEKSINSSEFISDELLQDLVSKTFASLNFPRLGECEDRSLSVLYGALEQVEGMQEPEEPLRGESEDGHDDNDLDANLCLLYKMIFAPVADLLEGPEIVICPEGHMFRIPFAALKDANGKYLADTFRLRLIPSLTTLKLIYDCPADYHSQTGALVVGDPTVGRVEFNGKLQELPSLPNARSEVQMVARLLGVSPLVGEQATKEEVVKRIQGVSLVHIAAHGDSERGEIAFAPNSSCDGIPKKEDFLLAMEDIATVGIRAKLVVLSCCHSGSGKILKSEGVVGIARAFLGSGARSVLVSLWAIDDAATKAFMNMFYKFLLRDKLSASEALHLSMKKMRESPLYSDIIYWAPFVLIGDDVTIDL